MGSGFGLLFFYHSHLFLPFFPFPPCCIPGLRGRGGREARSSPMPQPRGLLPPLARAASCFVKPGWWTLTAIKHVGAAKKNVLVQRSRKERWTFCRETTPGGRRAAVPGRGLLCDGRRAAGRAGTPGAPPSPEAPGGEALPAEPRWEHLPTASADALEEGAEQTHGDWQPAR